MPRLSTQCVVESRDAGSILVHPLFEYDLIGQNWDQNMTILDDKLRLKYAWYVKIKKINATIYNHKTKLKWSYLSNPLYSNSYNHHYKKALILIAVWSNEIQLKYIDRYEVHVKASKKSKKHDSFHKSNHFYDFFGQKVMIMTKK